ncbi:MAG: PocR ligand-binding domain-containing protein [Pontiellaceae bacterium]|nr:PocR ligand-binding domain-containing protein [Pontiellaceae bacterium]MBN2783605.1 PocR ligand-binding domain-containing protein [Pontiellaceae bacterium]
MDKKGVMCFYVHMSSSMHYTISSKVSEIFDLYTQLHDIRISLFSPTGDLIYPDRVGRPNCRHCIMLRQTLGMDSSCRELDRKMMQTSLQRGGMVTYTCHAGMREAAAPVFVGRELAGYVMLGQFRSEAAPERSPYADQWAEQQGNGELQLEYEQTAMFPEDKIETLLSMFRHLMEFIMESHLIQHKDYDLLEPVIEQIHAHPESDISLADAARLAGRSSSAVTRIFKRVTGRSFKQYQTDRRMEQAALMLRNSPSRPVADIGVALGYEDPLYFSRVFRKRYGCAPSAYRGRP